MDEILSLERKLKANKISIISLEHSLSTGMNESGNQKRLRELLIQRSAFKDMLLELYRNELIERRKDHEHVSDT